MIIPINGLKYYVFHPPRIDDEILLVKEKNNPFDDKAVAAYNHVGQKIGYVSKRCLHNSKVNDKMKQEDFIGKIWSIGKNQILVELDF